MTNVISQIFSDPVPGRDQEAIDLLELHVDSKLVQAIRETKTREAASRKIFELSDLVEGAKNLSENQKRCLHEWLSVVSQMMNESDQLSWPLCNRVGG